MIFDWVGIIPAIVYLGLAGWILRDIGIFSKPKRPTVWDYAASERFDSWWMVPNSKAEAWFAYRWKSFWDHAQV